MTTGSTGIVTIDLKEIWFRHWLRMWSDIGRVHYMREMEEHIPQHEVPRFLTGDCGWCECFNCRVTTAWNKRYALVQTGRTSYLDTRLSTPRSVASRDRERVKE